MLRIITVIPEEGIFSFSVKYCNQKISIPGFGCPLSNVTALIEPLLSYGCTISQVSLILEMIHGQKEGEVDREIDYEPDEDGDNEWD
jgi:hypothetical protein